jgi:uncharacterized membrane protein
MYNLAMDYAIIAGVLLAWIACLIFAVREYKSIRRTMERH